MDLKGVFDMQTQIYKEIADTNLIVIGAYPGGARAEITPRFTRHF